MPAVVVDDPLAVRFEFANGKVWFARLHGLPNPRLAADLAAGMAGCAHPHGGVGSVVTAQGYAWALRRAVRELSAAGFDGAATDLRRHHLTRLFLAGTRAPERGLRHILRAFDTATGVLDPQVRRLLDGTLIKARQRSSPLVPYSDSEWARIIARCETVVGEARRAQLDAQAAAARGNDPAGASYRAGSPSDDDIAWLLSARGPLDCHALAAHLGWPYARVGQAGAAEVLGRARAALFPTKDVIVAYQILFAAHSGIVADGINSIGLADIDWAGDRDVLVRYLKGRTGPEGLHLPKRAMAVLRQWLTYSAPLRAFAEPALAQRLWLFTYGPGWQRPPMILTPTKHTGSAPGWAQRQGGIAADDGTALELRRARLRTTHHSLLARRGWTGRTTIDPNHTAAVEGDHYLTATTPAQRDAIEAIIEDGQADVLRKALPPVVLALDDAAAVAAAHPDTVARLGLDDAAVAELVGGQRDVFTAGCANQLASPYGKAGQPCPARPWVCLLCPLAVFLPRHATNLLRLKAFFARQFRQMPTDAFLRVFGPYAHRLDHDILPRFNPLVLTAAAVLVSDDDRELPLRPEEVTQ